MQLARFVTFVCSDEDLSNELHVFAAGAHFVAPYPLTCRLTIFSEVVRERMVVVEGVRLGESNQFRLEELFPDLKNFRGVVHGLKVELSSHHPQVDLSETQVISDVRFKQHSVRFSPVGWGSKKGVDNARLGRSVRAMPLFDTDIYRTSIIIANETRQQITAADLGVRVIEGKIDPPLGSSARSEGGDGRSNKELVEILDSIVPPLNCLAWDVSDGSGHLIVNERVSLGGCFVANWSNVTGRLISVGVL